MKVPIIPCGHRVVVLPDTYEGMTKGGIVIPDFAIESRQFAMTRGTLVAVGPSAWMDFGNQEPWAKEGDIVIYAKYGGAEFYSDGENGDRIVYRLMNDEDILGVIVDGETVKTKEQEL